MNTSIGRECLVVTGASGYLGRNITRQFVAKGWNVRGLVRSDASAKLVEQLGAQAVRGDILDRDSLDELMQGASSLIHAAADTGHGAGSAAQDRTNLEGTANVFAAAMQAGVGRAIQISTEAVLLTGKPLIHVKESDPLPTNPAGAYSRTKAEAERIALSHDGSGMAVMAVRPRFVWGRDDTTALPQLVEAARSGKLVWIDGGEYLTSTTHIDNLVHGLELALEKGEGGEVYFLTDGAPTGFRTFVTALLETQGVAPPVKTVPRPLVLGVARIGDALARLSGGRVSGPMSFQEYATLGVEVTLDISKAQDALGYQPVISRKQGVEALARDYRRSQTKTP